MESATSILWVIGRQLPAKRLAVEHQIVEVTILPGPANLQFDPLFLLHAPSIPSLSSFKRERDEAPAAEE